MTTAAGIAVVCEISTCCITDIYTVDKNIGCIVSGYYVRGGLSGYFLIIVPAEYLVVFAVGHHIVVAFLACFERKMQMCCGITLADITDDLSCLNANRSARQSIGSFACVILVYTCLLISAVYVIFKCGHMSIKCGYVGVSVVSERLVKQNLNRAAIITCLINACVISRA